MITDIDEAIAIPISKADKLFKDMGFIKHETKKYVDGVEETTELYYETEKKEGDYQEMIEFVLYDDVVSYYWKDKTVLYQYCVYYSSSIIIAINEKMKELGWIK